MVPSPRQPAGVHRCKVSPCDECDGAFDVCKEQGRGEAVGETCVGTLRPDALRKELFFAAWPLVSRFMRRNYKLTRVLEWLPERRMRGMLRAVFRGWRHFTDLEVNPWQTLDEWHPAQFSRTFYAAGRSEIRKFWNSQRDHPSYADHPMHEHDFDHLEHACPFFFHGDDVAAVAKDTQAQGE